MCAPFLVSGQWAAGGGHSQSARPFAKLDCPIWSGQNSQKRGVPLTFYSSLLYAWGWPLALNTAFLARFLHPSHPHQEERRQAPARLAPSVRFPYWNFAFPGGEEALDPPPRADPGGFSCRSITGGAARSGSAVAQRSDNTTRGTMPLLILHTPIVRTAQMPSGCSECAPLISIPNLHAEVRSTGSPASVLVRLANMPRASRLRPWPSCTPGAARALVSCVARIDRRVTGEQQVCLRTTR